MKTIQERFALLQDALIRSGMPVERVEPFPSVCAPFGDDLSEYGFERVSWAPYVWQGSVRLPSNHQLFAEHRIFAIGLASVFACLQVNCKPGNKVLDMCAAPGIKSLCLQLLHQNQLDLYVNDLSHDRLIRLRSLFEQFSCPLPTFSNQPGQTLARVYPEQSFDAVLLDAPCSGEGTILGGDDAALQTWSPAKVKRLAGLQRKLLMTADKLCAANGTLVYATCTLNKTENESVIRKSGLPEPVVAQDSQQQLRPGQAVRLLPSKLSIGFFVANIR
jgi:16S rRNA C967 or C1407 C5-methylase (RsmB/RsmF family)